MFTLAIDANNVIDTCLDVMVKLTATITCQLTSTGILSVSKVLAFKAMQGIRNKWFNRYVKITFFDRCRKSWKLNVRTKVFIGNSSLLRRTFIRLTEVTSSEDKFWQMSSSLTPSKSLHLITAFEELREECAVTLIGTLWKTVDFRRQLECCTLN